MGPVMKKRAILIGCSLWLIQLTGLLRAYIPAQPSNESSLVQPGVNDTQQMSILELQWVPKSLVAGVSAYRFQSSDMQGFGQVFSTRGFICTDRDRQHRCR